MLTVGSWPLVSTLVGESSRKVTVPQAMQLLGPRRACAILAASRPQPPPGDWCTRTRPPCAAQEGEGRNKGREEEERVEDEIHLACGAHHNLFPNMWSPRQSHAKPRQNQQI